MARNKANDAASQFTIKDARPLKPKKGWTKLKCSVVARGEGLLWWWWVVQEGIDCQHTAGALESLQLR